MVINGNSKHQSVLELKNKRISQLNIYLLIMRLREYVKNCTTSKNFALPNIASGVVQLSIPSTSICQLPIYQYIQSGQKKKKVISHNFVRQPDSETKKSINEQQRNIQLSQALFTVEM